jgi:uronate dehydrogenase
MRVLVTGAAGAIGQPVCVELERRGHAVRGFDRRAGYGADFVQADLADRAAVDRAMQGVDAVVHLGAMPDDGPFLDLVHANVHGLYNVLDAARRGEVKRVALASSIQVVNGRPQTSAVVGTEARFPDNHYGLTKLWAEDMGEMYARCFAMQIVAARICWMVRNRREAELIVEKNALSHYVSRGDTARFFAQAVETPELDFAVLYVAGPAGGDFLDLDSARCAIGYEPRDAWPEGLPDDAAAWVATLRN